MMRRVPLKPGKGFQRKSPMPTTGILSLQAHQRSAPARKAKLKSKGPRMTPIRRAARGQECTLRFQGCNWDPATTVLCHSPFLTHGRGMGLKSPDEKACFGCSFCHDVLDGRRPRPPGLSALDVEGCFYVAMRVTHQILRRLGLMPAAPTLTESEQP